MSAKGTTALIGKRFGELVVISDTGKRVRGQIIFNVQCNCGREVEMRRDYFDRKKMELKDATNAPKGGKLKGMVGFQAHGGDNILSNGN